MTDVDAFILVGGKSSRLGTNKALAELDGKTLAGRAVETVRAAMPSSSVTVVAGSSTQFAIGAIRNDVPFIFDLHEGRGPLGGLHAALAYTKTSWIFLLACDYPFVSPELISLLGEMIRDDHGTVVPEQSDGRLQPLCAFYNVKRALPLVEEWLETPRVPPPMQELVRMLDPRIVKPDEYVHLADADRLFVNINTKDDLLSARSSSKS